MNNIEKEAVFLDTLSLSESFPFCTETISIITNDGRNIVGVLKGFDQATNIILDESHERVYSTKEGVQQLVLGFYIIRGDNISVVGELDEELDSSLDLQTLEHTLLRLLSID
ncbi:sm-like protein LSM8 [Hibiscus syriacus]|uniref:sm-like protein LSM8 n=1 Tax=Hibiscus syriacus TaxID=106335 RepID=UPI0019226CA7|nr:sm-like protein LSM8 [Hibiscus syriacus]